MIRVRSRVAVVVGLTLCLILSVATPEPARAQGELPPSCPYGDVTVIAARGSGEDNGDPLVIDSPGTLGRAVKESLDRRLGPLGVSVGLYGVEYPATAVNAEAWAFTYGPSVVEGRDALLAELHAVSEICGPEHPVVLVGYSQGAHVVQESLGVVAADPAVVDLPVAVGLVASPQFMSSDPSARGSFPPRATGIAPWVLSAVSSGLGTTGVVENRYSQVTRSWCLSGDPVCDASIVNGISFGAFDDDVHTSGYGSWVVTDIAATAIWAIGARGLPVPSPEPDVDPFDAPIWFGDGGEITFSAAPVAGVDGPIDRYLFDYDGDGVVDSTSSRPMSTATYTKPAGWEVGMAWTVSPRIEVAGPQGHTKRYELCLDVQTGEACATFTDIENSVFLADIEWMAAEGITKGCNPPANDKYCPDDAVSRGQMAAFLVRALGLTDRLDDPFTDDDDSIFEADIEKLAAAGITSGCNPPMNDEFCPKAKVTRGQMAAFLGRALGYTDDGGGNYFTDTAGSVFKTDIDRLATAGVTKGCNPPANTKYCPNNDVTRGQMAAFLHRALG
ncbi:MAG: cutinase family protein [Actinomycetota bacterium]|nr:cutinase family protein [Actinomycetota bacterium]